MKCKIGGQTVELEIEGRVGSGVKSRQGVGQQAMHGETSSLQRRRDNREAESLTNGRAVRFRLETTQGSSPPSPYRSKLEAQYAQHLDMMKRAGEIGAWWYEPIRFRLPGTRNFYKADFLLRMPNSWIQIHEVKGWSKNRREGITKLKTAAGLNTWATFYLVQWDQKRRVWDKQIVQV